MTTTGKDNSKCTAVDINKCPKDIVLYILSRLEDVKDAINISRVSKAFRRYIFTSIPPSSYVELYHEFDQSGSPHEYAIIKSQNGFHGFSIPEDFYKEAFCFINTSFLSLESQPQKNQKDKIRHAEFPSEKIDPMQLNIRCYINLKKLVKKIELGTILRNYLPIKTLLHHFHQETGKEQDFPEDFLLYFSKLILKLFKSIPPRKKTSVLFNFVLPPPEWYDEGNEFVIQIFM
jgi:hypothetical protein